MKYYVAIQKNELELYQMFWKVFHGVMLVETSKMEKTTYNMIPFCATVIISCYVYTCEYWYMVIWTGTAIWKGTLRIFNAIHSIFLAGCRLRHMVWLHFLVPLWSCELWAEVTCVITSELKQVIASSRPHWTHFPLPDYYQCSGWQLLPQPGSQREERGAGPPASHSERQAGEKWAVVMSHSALWAFSFSIT